MLIGMLVSRTTDGELALAYVLVLLLIAGGFCVLTGAWFHR